MGIYTNSQNELNKMHVQSSTCVYIYMNNHMHRAHYTGQERRGEKEKVNR